MSKPYTIYLAGPMDQVDHATMTDWREQVKSLFESEVEDGLVKLLDPCRRPHTDDLNMDEVFNLDLLDVKNSDIMLVDIRYMPRETWGTASEIFYAYKVLEIPIIGWSHGDVLQKRLFLNKMVTHQFNVLSDATDHIKTWYL